MGISKYKDSLYVANISTIIKFDNNGPESVTEDNVARKFDANYYPRLGYINPDLDLHDLGVTDNGIFYCSALFNCICKASTEKSFELYWKPPWISYSIVNDRKFLAQEDRCHLNGMCIVDGFPRYVTAACTGDFYGAWREQHKQGVVYDIKEEKF
jgi:uncharacterized protein (TIGR03032 family)